MISPNKHNENSNNLFQIPSSFAHFRFNEKQFELVFATDTFFQMLGYTKEEFETLPENSYGMRSCTDEESGRLIQTIFEQSKEKQFFNVSFNAMKKDGSSLYLYLHFYILHFSDGYYTASVMISDPFLLGKPGDTVSSDHRLLIEIVSLSPEIICEYNVQTDCMQFSSMENGVLVRQQPIENFSVSFKENGFVHDDDYELFDKLCESFRNNNCQVFTELRIFDPILQRFDWHRFIGKVLYNQNGEPTLVIGRMTNISDYKNEEHRLMEKAQRDPLTKIYNKSTTETLIKDYMRSDPGDSISALMVIDVDNFKAVNDNLGHLFGDSILQDLSMEMQDLFRSSDVVGRIGGDEFMVYLRGVKHRKHIEDKARDICKIFELLYSGENGDKITGSLGISIFPDDGTEFEDLFKKADMAMYHSKRTGKNTFSFYGDLSKESLDEQKHINRNRYQGDLQNSGQSSLFDSEITDFAFDIMNKTKDVNSAINLLLSKVGKHFNIHYVSVMEVIDLPLTLKNTYQWSGKVKLNQFGNIFPANESQWAKMLSTYDDNDIRCYSDIFSENADIDDYTKQRVIGGGGKALLECAIYVSGEYKGCGCFYDCIKKRVWTVDEVKALKTISKIVSSYLLKMRAFEKANALVDRLTNYDKLTELPSFHKFEETVKSYIDEAEDGTQFALVCADFNNFKYVNEKHGSNIGDEVLKRYADALMNLELPAKAHCRMFSDKFLSFFVVHDIDLLVKEFSLFINDYTAMERKLLTDNSISMFAGVYHIESTKGFDINIAIDSINIARKLTRHRLENTCILYRDEMKKEHNFFIEILDQAKKALLNQEFVVFYQPKYSLKDNRIVGAEALVRWVKPDGTIIRPDQFIPYLERNGYIVNVDFYVYEQVCKYIRSRLDQGKRILPISLNVSRIHLEDPTFLNRLVSLVDKYQIPANLLEFELTESVFLGNQYAAVSTMEELKKRGFLVSIDDFGSGFSSLNLLKNLPVDILKIDKEFFGNYTFKANDEIVISCIINMASKMNISVICEGVETKEQVSFLKNTTCDMAQGYYFARPGPQQALDQKLDEEE
jgi:diguanylate cyclase (GGDEF)-like protein